MYTHDARLGSGAGDDTGRLHITMRSAGPEIISIAFLVWRLQPLQPNLVVVLEYVPKKEEP